MRQLATIQKISKLEPIPEADAIERASVLGWQLVVKKGDFKEGDMCVYCEIDSLLPDKPEYEFLKPRGMRIKTIRLRGQVSQGIAFPLSILPPDFSYDLGTDCSEVLGITKYEAPTPACLSGKAKGKLPGFIPKTDETRVQVLQKVLDKYQGERCYITEKLDGSSATYYLNNGEFGVCSRNLDLLEDEDNSFWKVARQQNIEEKLRSLGMNIAIQGELVGEGIQDNKLKLKGQTVFFFNAFDIDKFEYYGYEAFKSLIDTLELNTVPVLSDEFCLTSDIEQLVKLSTIKSKILNTAWAEGIVIRPVVEKIDLLLSTENFNNGRVTFKVINPEFLLKYGE